MRILGAVVEIPMLTVRDSGEDLALRSPIAFALLRDEHPWDILASLEELPEELPGGVRVAPPLHQNIQDNPVLIHRPPQLVALFVDGDEHLVQMPCIPKASVAPP
jgi:hypothetical protein